MAICVGGHVTDSLKATYTALKAIPVLSANDVNSVLLSRVTSRHALDRTAPQVHRSPADAHPDAQPARGHECNRRNAYNHRSFAFTCRLPRVVVCARCGVKLRHLKLGWQSRQIEQTRRAKQVAGPWSSVEA